MVRIPSVEVDLSVTYAQIGHAYLVGETILQCVDNDSGCIAFLLC